MTSITRQRRVTPEVWRAARETWRAGEPWADEWKPWRHLAAIEAGIIVAPKGSAFDCWDDAEPSERALLIRAIRETPALLDRAIRSPGVRSWAAIVAIVVRGRDGMRKERVA